MYVVWGPHAKHRSHLDTCALTLAQYHTAIPRTLLDIRALKFSACWDITGFGIRSFPTRRLVVVELAESTLEENTLFFE
uniref:Uncharacterized protein n=1 Tax=Steinernema glaseri TaxID=37863 RepID=A0A1I7Y2I1_9BILA